MPVELKDTNMSNKKGSTKIPTDGRQSSWLFSGMTEKLTEKKTPAFHDGQNGT